MISRYFRFLSKRCRRCVALVTLLAFLFGFDASSMGDGFSAQRPIAAVVAAFSGGQLVELGYQ